MPFDGKNFKKTDIETTDLEALCRVLERTQSFNLGKYRWERHAEHPCGTPACILGHAWALWPGTDRMFVVDSLKEIAGKIGVDPESLCVLTHGFNSYGYAPGGVPVRSVTGKMAAAALRRLRDTGEAYFSLEDA